MLTAKQELFARKVVEGMSQADAYRSAYSTKRMSDKQIWEEASKLASSPKVAQRIKELRDKAANESILTAQERMKWLTELIRNQDEGTNEKLKAIDLLNKMSGEYVQRVEAEVKQETTICVELVDDED